MPLNPPIRAAFWGGGQYHNPERWRIIAGPISRFRRSSRSTGLGGGGRPRMCARNTATVYAQRRIACRTRRSSWILAWLLCPCLSAFIAELAFPNSVLGPVARRHGCQRRMRAACRARRSGVQPAFPRIKSGARRDKLLGRCLAPPLFTMPGAQPKCLVMDDDFHFQ
jgi:hypothetical protein